MSPEDSTKPIRNIVFLSIPTIFIFIIAAFVHFSSYSQLSWIQIPFHSAIEAAGALIALILSSFLLLSKGESSDDNFKVLAASALIGMGVFDLFHSFLNPGQAFVWLHTVATLIGGSIFSLVWFQKKIPPGRAILPVLVLIGSWLLASLWILFPESIPLMIDESNDFTLFARLANIIGGFGFFLGSAWFFENYYHSTDGSQILFANLCLLLGVSGAIFGYSTMWNLEWWLWHATRFSAYLFAFILILKIHENTELQKEEISVELQDAMSKIKILSGFLPICSGCKKIRDNNGYWSQIESYITKHSEAKFSHGICPECTEKLYPELKIHKQGKLWSRRE